MPDTTCGSPDLRDVPVDGAVWSAFVVPSSRCTVVCLIFFLRFMIVSYGSLTGGQTAWCADGGGQRASCVTHRVGQCRLMEMRCRFFSGVGVHGIRISRMPSV